MIEDKKNKGIVFLLLKLLNENKIPYVVLRNYKTLPEKPLAGSDIDILIDKNSQKVYRRILFRAIRKSDAFLLSKIHHFNCLSYFIYQKDPYFFTWIDAFTRIATKSFVWADGNFLLKDRIWHQSGFYILSPGAEAAVLFLKEVMTGSPVKKRYRPIIQKLAKKDEITFIQTLSLHFGQESAKEMFQIASNGKWNEAFKKRRKWWRVLIFRNFCHPIKQIFYSLSFFWYYFKEWFNPRKGIIIAVIGPDGIGKTAICQNLAKKMKNVYFSAIYQYHGQIGIFPELGQVYQKLFKKNISNDAISRENKIGFFRAILHIFYYGLENLLSWPWLYWLKIKRNLIIFDRYFYEFIIATTNSKIISWLFWQIAKVIPRPDLLFIIKSKPEKIYQRKKELSLKEIKRQLGIFQNRKISRITLPIFINNEGAIDAALEKIENEILKTLSKKYAGK